MRVLMAVAAIALAGCQSVMKLDSDGNIVELKGGKAMRAYVAIVQAREREERYRSLKAMATVPSTTEVGEATRAMLAQTILFYDSAGVEAQAYHKAEAQNNARPWSLARTALWALPAWYLAFNGSGGDEASGISLDDGSSITVNASNSGTSGGTLGPDGAIVPGSGQSRVLNIGLGGEMLNQTNFASGQISGPTEKLIQTKDSPGITPVLDDSGDGSGNEAGLLQ